MKRLLVCLFATVAFLSAEAQYSWEYGISLGGANYLGDIGGKLETRRDFVWDMHLGQTRFAVGSYGRYKFSRRFAVNLGVNYLRIQDADRLTTNPQRRARNLNFRNRIWDISARAEVTLFYDNDVGGRGYYNPDFKLYVFGGVSAFNHNPQGQIYKEGELAYDGEWFDLQPWQTEGVEYSKWGVAIPAGIGFYFTFDKIWRVGWELSWRTTFTDYIDDISTFYVDPSTLDPQAAEFASQTYTALVAEVNQTFATDAFYDPQSINDHRYMEAPHDRVKRGDNTNNDSYLTTQITLGRVIRGQSSFYKRKYGWLRQVRKSRAKF